MPRVNGKELAQRLKKMMPGMVVLFMSGYSETVIQNGMLDDGFNFLQKPFTPTALLRKLREVLDGARGGPTGRGTILLERGHTESVAARVAPVGLICVKGLPPLDIDLSIVQRSVAPLKYVEQES